MLFQVEVELPPSIAFQSLALSADSFAYYAFYLTRLDHFQAGIGAKSICRLPGWEGAFISLRDYQRKAKGRICGYLAYDLKNDIENLSSENPVLIDLPEAVFFSPEIWCDYREGTLYLSSDQVELLHEFTASIKAIKEQETSIGSWELHALTSRETYIQQVNRILGHLNRGDIYEANYCMGFRGKATLFESLATFIRLQNLTEAPFSVFARLDSVDILSASPERFLQKTGNQLISQPIKGTRKRGASNEADAMAASALQSDPKERSENVMIVDLVRNDLSRIAARNTVKVQELFELQTFKTVHHLVSTIACEIDSEKYDHWDAIMACFPMGSMTGAPKISAMKIIESCENFKRGGYSGAFGWIDSNGDFDFNVLIRTLFYDRLSEELALAVGSAITLASNPENEYAECLLKAEALLKSIQELNEIES